VRASARLPRYDHTYHAAHLDAVASARGESRRNTRCGFWALSPVARSLFTAIFACSATRAATLGVSAEYRTVARPRPRQRYILVATDDFGGCRYALVLASVDAAPTRKLAERSKIFAIAGNRSSAGFATAAACLSDASTRAYGRGARFAVAGDPRDLPTHRLLACTRARGVRICRTARGARRSVTVGSRPLAPPRGDASGRRHDCFWTIRHWQSARSSIH